MISDGIGWPDTYIYVMLVRRSRRKFIPVPPISIQDLHVGCHIIMQARELVAPTLPP